MDKRKIILLVVILVVLAGAGYGGQKFYRSINPVPDNSVLDNVSEQGGDDAQKVTYVKQLTESPIAQTTRSVFTVLTSTSTKGRAEILKHAPFRKGIADSLTDEKLQSKFIVVNGSEIPAVGAQIYLVFPNQPDTIFRAAYQATRSTTTPFVLVDFEATEDKASDIQTFLNSVKSYISDPNMGQ